MKSYLFQFGRSCTFNELTFPNPFAIPRNTRKDAKMEIFNEEVTRGIRTANFASVRVFSGGLIPDGSLLIGAPFKQVGKASRLTLCGPLAFTVQRLPGAVRTADLFLPVAHTLTRRFADPSVIWQGILSQKISKDSKNGTR
jgi:hypothetical protein